MKYLKTYEQTEDKSTITKLDTSSQDLSEYTNLKELYCYNNQLTELPELPNSLIYFECW